MTQQFNVGEICIVQHADSPYAHLNGTECVVVDAFSIFCALQHCDYLIKCVDGEKYLARQYHLRKKRPPQQYSGETRIRELFDQSPVERSEPAEIA